MKNTPPFPATDQNIKHPRLEAWIHIALWLAIIASVLSIIAFAVYKFDLKERTRAREQHQLEQKAISERHAVEARP